MTRSPPAGEGQGQAVPGAGRHCPASQQAMDWRLASKVRLRAECGSHQIQPLAFFRLQQLWLPSTSASRVTPEIGSALAPNLQVVGDGDDARLADDEAVSSATSRMAADSKVSPIPDDRLDGPVGGMAVSALAKRYLFWPLVEHADTDVG